MTQIIKPLVILSALILLRFGTMAQCDCSSDVSAPVFSGTTAFFQEMCMPPITLDSLTVSDDCDTLVDVQATSQNLSSQLYNGVVPSLAGNPCSTQYSSIWSLSFFYPLSSVQYFVPENITYREYDNGMAHVYGRMHISNNTAALLDIDFWFNNAMDWTTWDNQPWTNGYKADCGGIPANHQDWTYYLMMPNSIGVGHGGLEGTNLRFSHIPVSLFYAFQKGYGANNLSPDFGFGGWLLASGSFVYPALGYNYSSISIQGDLALNLEESCLLNSQLISYTAQDNCGHQTQAFQMIDNMDTVAPSLANPLPSSTEVCSTFTPWQAEWLSDCNGSLVSSINDVIVGDSYNYNQSATDACGNTTQISFSQTILNVDCNGGGCTDPAACNYSSLATVDNGSCHYFNDQANAGSDVYLAEAGVFSAPLNANTPLSHQSGSWTIVSGTGTIQGGTQNPQATFLFDSGAYASATLAWTILDSICNATVSDTVFLNITGCSFLPTGLFLESTECLGSSALVAGTEVFAPLSAVWLTTDNQSLGNATVLTVQLDNIGSVQYNYTIDISACNTTETSITQAYLFDVQECIYGCMDILACNYNSAANVEDGSCLYSDVCSGCTDPNASNFQATALYEDGSCNYNEVFVFYDVNGDGIHQLSEPGLQSWPVHIASIPATFYTNNVGFVDFVFSTLPIQVDLFNNTTNWISTNAISQTAVLGDMPQFGLMPVDQESAEVDLPYSGYSSFIDCVEGNESGVHIRNTGAVSLDGVITVTCDALFTPVSDAFGNIGPNVSSAGFAQWDVLNYQPGANDLFSFHVEGPSDVYQGQSFDFLYDVLLISDNGNEVYHQTYTQTMQVVCNAQNDGLVAQPVGYREPHYILAGETIEYRLNFRNLGNSPINSIDVRDVLNPLLVDISTFEPLYGSVSFTGCLHDDGIADFIIPDSQLPPSTVSPEASHGFVVFKIKTWSTLAHGTVIPNVGQVYFDGVLNNETNSVFHTIFECDSLPGISGENNLCPGDSSVLFVSSENVESYQWTADNEVVGVDSLIAINNSMSFVSVLLQNPICAVERQIEVIHLNAPQIAGIADVELCEGSSTILNAISDGIITWSNGIANGAPYTPSNDEVVVVTSVSEQGCVSSAEEHIVMHPNPVPQVDFNNGVLSVNEGEQWQWFLSTTEIPFASASSYQPLVSGLYSVKVWNSFGCSGVSQALFVEVSVTETDFPELKVYPNPATENLHVVWPNQQFELSLYDELGNLVFKKVNLQNQSFIEFEDLSAGVYTLRIQGLKGSSNRKIVVN